MENSSNQVLALLGPTNTGKTFVAIEKMLKYESGIFGFPLRLLAREVYDKCVSKVGCRQSSINHRRGKNYTKFCGLFYLYR